MDKRKIKRSKNVQFDMNKFREKRERNLDQYKKDVGFDPGEPKGKKEPITQRKVNFKQFHTQPPDKDRIITTNMLAQASRKKQAQAKREFQNKVEQERLKKEEEENATS